jgi:CheY-like chemotaxis protein
MKLLDARILVVDDEPALREIFTQWLKVLGCGDVRCAADGEAALAAIAAQPIDLLVTDVRMPVMDGVALVRRLGELGSTIPSIVFVSGFGDVDPREMYDLGVEAFLAKPLHRQTLIECLKSAIDDREELWLTPAEPTPRQHLLAEVKCVGHDATCGSLCLGRGGFATRTPTPLAIGKVAFEIHFTAPHGAAPKTPTWSGEGVVRWYSKAEQSAGVEFTYLDPACREAILGCIAALNPRSFIPSCSTPRPC